jgi:hypothetical protein
LGGLPPLKEELARREKQLRAPLTKETNEQIEIYIPRIQARLNVIQDYSQMKRDRTEQKEHKQPHEEYVTAVAEILGRKVTPVERILIQQMQRQGKEAAEMATILRQLQSASPKS